MNMSDRAEVEAMLKAMGLGEPQTVATTRSVIIPRLIRYRDAPGYLGMDRSRFDTEVRPGITEIPIGDRGIAFDRLDLDAWVEEYKSSNGRPSRKTGVVACVQGLKEFKSRKAVSELQKSSTGAAAFSSASETLVRKAPKLGSGLKLSKSTPNLTKLLAEISRQQP